MYSSLIIDQKLHRARQSGKPVHPRTVSDSIGIAKKLDALTDQKSGHYTRPLTKEETGFIQSETVICACDFAYFAERYGHIELDADDGGGTGPIRLWDAQRISLRQTAKREEEMWAEYNKYGTTAGILQVDHKVRQVGRTAVTRLQLFHRMLFRRSYRCLSATIASPNDKNKMELYRRDKIILDNLPHFLKPRIKYDVSKELIHFDTPMSSHMAYADSEQRAGIGTGAQSDGHHITEGALWDNLDRLMFEFIPAVPRSPWTFGTWESTPSGRNNPWHELTENVRRKKRGFEHWVYNYTPWYLIRKYRAAPPSNWSPDETTLNHAAVIERTSPEFNEGNAVRPTLEQLYWWESQREFHNSTNQLNVFYSNYSATPEESFQHVNQGGFPYKTIEWMRQSSLTGMPYEVRTVQMAGLGL